MHAAITADEFAEAEAAVKADPGFRRALSSCERCGSWIS
jgi:hypothetical protein